MPHLIIQDLWYLKHVSVWVFMCFCLWLCTGGDSEIVFDETISENNLQKRLVVKEVQVPIERIVENIITQEVPVERIFVEEIPVYIERIVVKDIEVV